MVKLWPWKGDDSSPAAFEKALSTLSSKIGQASSSLEKTRQRGRRLKALWTIYSSFAYLLYLMIASLVIGWQNWGPVEYTAVSSAPVAIFFVRFSLSSYHDYWISKQQAHLQTLQKQRDDTISKLKEATKYNTTQQLLEKYGGTPQKPASKAKKEKSPGPRLQTSKRRETTGFVPPPTANIPNRRVVSATVPSGIQQLDETHYQGGPGSAPEGAATAGLTRQRQDQDLGTSTGAEFAPNAFSEPRLYAPTHEGSKWYDRLMDVVLGEDEASPKNRLALICHECRLVNGQAPPGIKTLEEIGKWRCSACGTMNGEDMVAKRMVENLASPMETTTASIPSGEATASDQHYQGGDREDEVDGSDHTVYSEDEEPAAISPVPAPAKKRGRPKKTKS